MMISELLSSLQNFDNSLQVYIASTVLMPLSDIELETDSNAIATKLVLVQQKRICENNPLLYATVDDVLGYVDYLKDQHNLIDTLDVVLQTNLVRSIEKIEEHTIATVLKKGSNKIVAVKDAWDAHPVDESTARQAVIIFTPL